MPLTRSTHVAMADSWKTNRAILTPVKAVAQRAWWQEEEVPKQKYIREMTTRWQGDDKERKEKRQEETERRRDGDGDSDVFSLCLNSMVVQPVFLVQRYSRWISEPQSQPLSQFLGQPRLHPATRLPIGRHRAFLPPSFFVCLCYVSHG